MRSRFLLIAAVSLLGYAGYVVGPMSVAGPPTTQDEKDRAAKMSADIQRVLTAESGQAAREAYKALFRQVTPEEIRRLKVDEHDSIALRAAWEEVRLTLPQYEQSALIHPDRRILQSFLGFLQGRLRLCPPKWWEELLLDCRAYDRSSISFSFFKPELTQVPSPDLVIPIKGPDVSQVAEALGITERVPRPFPGSMQDLRQGPRLSQSECRVHDKRYVADQDSSFCTPYSLYCVQSKTGKAIWEASVWAANRDMFYAGRAFHWVEVVADEDRVVVFGAGFDAVYVESFNAKTGANLFRFSTSY
jgi:hypothetical protein